MSDKIAEIVAYYVEEAKVDHTGLWEIVIRVRHDMDGLDPEESREIVLQIARGIMVAGVPAVTSSETGYRPWSDQDPDRTVARISKEWNDLGRDPNPGEIVWFGPEFIFGARPG